MPLHNNTNLDNTTQIVTDKSINLGIKLPLKPRIFNLYDVDPILYVLNLFTEPAIENNHF